VDEKKRKKPHEKSDKLACLAGKTKNQIHKRNTRVFESENKRMHFQVDTVEKNN